MWPENRLGNALLQLICNTLYKMSEMNFINHPSATTGYDNDYGNVFDESN